MSMAIVHAQYQCTVKTSTHSTVTLRTIGYGKNAKIASSEAEINAIRMILFTGANNTSFKYPLISEDKDKIESEFSDFFSGFYESGYQDFIESSVIVTPYGKNATKHKCITLDVCIRVERLRSYLESKNIIRKFGL